MRNLDLGGDEECPAAAVYQEQGIRGILVHRLVEVRDILHGLMVDPWTTSPSRSPESASGLDGFTCFTTSPVVVGGRFNCCAMFGVKLATSIPAEACCWSPVSLLFSACSVGNSCSLMVSSRWLPSCTTFSLASEPG